MAKKPKFPVPVAALQSSRSESPMPPDSSSSAEVVTIGEQKLRNFKAFACLLKLVYWYCKGSELKLHFRLSPDQVAKLRRKRNAGTALAAFKRIHSVFFGDFQPKSKHQCPIIVRELVDAVINIDLELVLTFKTFIWVGHKPDDASEATAYIVKYTPDIIKYILDAEGKPLLDAEGKPLLDAEGKPKHQDAFVEAACWGNFAPGENDDAFKCDLKFAVIDDYEAFRLLKQPEL